MELMRSRHKLDIKIYNVDVFASVRGTASNDQFLVRPVGVAWHGTTVHRSGLCYGHTVDESEHHYKKL